MKKDLAIRALEMAINLGQPPKGCIFHSGRGGQYRSYDFQKKLQAHGLRPSMRGKCNCSGIKLGRPDVRQRALSSITQNGFYNPVRRHS
jgi:transposase InsO family protein